MRFWQIKCPAVSGQLDAWERAERAGGKALKAIVKKVGATDLGTCRSFFTCVPNKVGFRFDGPVNTDEFTKADQDGYRRPKASNKALKAEIDAAIAKFMDLEPVYKALEITGKQFSGFSIWCPRFAKKDGVWYFSANDVYDGCKIVKRISDVQMDKLFPVKKKQTV